MVYFYPFYIMKYKMHTEKSSRTQNNCPATHHRHPCDHRPAPEAHHPPKCVCRPAHRPRPPPAARPVPTPRLYSGLAFDLDLSARKRRRPAFAPASGSRPWASRAAAGGWGVAPSLPPLSRCTSFSTVLSVVHQLFFFFCQLFFKPHLYS